MVRRRSIPDFRPGFRGCKEKRSQKFSELNPGPVCTVSTEGAARVASVLAVYVMYSGIVRAEQYVSF